MRHRIPMAALLCLLPLATGAVPAGCPPDLAGTTWHTVRIEGDALFLVIRDVGIRFEDATRFALAVRLLDGQQTSRHGTYRWTAAGQLALTIAGLGQEKLVTVRCDGPDLILHDRPFDVTVRLAPGAMEKERWF